MSKQEVIICKDFRSELEQVVGNQPAEQIFILTDTLTRKFCLPLLLESEKLAGAHIFSIVNGDEHKNLDSLTAVWQFLSDNGATRRSLMINLGGGMITDLGGFAASTFKRGMRYINIPTTILGAVDAAVGGKTGINFNGLKNEIGVINPADFVLVNARFFNSLSTEQILNGSAEMIKTALIADENLWSEMRQSPPKGGQPGFNDAFVERCIEIKKDIVERDPYEQNIRKALNFGHTVGHAFESFSYEKNTPVLHGYAVAWGMICELYLSYRTLNFPKEKLQEICCFIGKNYGSFAISCKDYDRLFELMTHDKKNDSKEINFTLLGDIGDIRINQHVSQNLIFDSFDFFCDM
ncbi:MAG: 3-dehydroquinate synthase [Prevotellaceae bacterium]|nr:3-dehydroquinate synthase [Prevotellaceae bacterium]